MNRRLRFDRRREIQRVRIGLERDGFPRLQMSLLVALTGGVGFVASSVMLHHGLMEMWLRYLAAFGLAYLAFLVLLWVWLRCRDDDYAGLADILPQPPSSGGSSAHSSGGRGEFAGGRAEFAGGGGEFAGGGASASFEAPVAEAAEAAPVGEIGSALAKAGEADEFAVPLVVVVLVATLLLSSFFMVWSAPALFAELLVDGVLSASLYRTLRGLETRHWLGTAIRRTVVPFAVTAALVSASGWAMARYAPEARSIGDVLAHARDVAEADRGRR